MNVNVIERLQQEQLRKDLTPFKVGDTIRVYSRIKEGSRVRAVWKDERQGSIRDIDHFELI